MGAVICVGIFVMFWVAVFAYGKGQDNESQRRAKEQWIKDNPDKQW